MDPPTKKRRPMGLKKAAQQNQQRTQTEQDAAAAPQADSQTVWLQGADQDMDEVDEAALLLKNAVAMLSEDPGKARLLLQGTVHECDRMLRNTSAGGLPGRFYATYAQTLCELGELQDDEESSEFITLARHFIERGQEALGDNTADQQELALAGGRVMLAQARMQLYRAIAEEDDSLDLDALETLVEQADQQLERGLTMASTETGREDARRAAASLMLAHAELRDDWNGRERWCQRAITFASGDVATYDATTLTVQASAYMSMAGWWLERQDEDQEAEELPESVANWLNSAEQLFARAVAAYGEDDGEVAPVLVQRAECQINCGNIAADNDAEAACYERAIALLKQAVAFEYPLPEQLQCFLDDWEGEDTDMA